MEINFKYEVGAFVRLKHSPSTAVHIAERLAQECPGGIQLHYTGKVYSAAERWRRKDEDKEEFQIITKMEKFLEHELGEVVNQ